jgi:hypothetical protein
MDKRGAELPELQHMPPGSAMLSLGGEQAAEP